MTATRIPGPRENPRGGGGSATIDTIAFYGAIGGGFWLAYTLALQGSLGTEAKRIALQIYAALHGGAAPAPSGTPTLPGGVTGPPPTAPPPSTGGGGSGGAPIGGNNGGGPTFAPVQPEGGDNAGWYWVKENPGWMLYRAGDWGDDANWEWGGLDNFEAQTGWPGFMASANV